MCMPTIILILTPQKFYFKSMDNFLDKFIEALKIFRMYVKTPYPCWCNIKEFHVGVDPETIPYGEKERLDELGWIYDSDTESFYIVI